MHRTIHTGTSLGTFGTVLISLLLIEKKKRSFFCLSVASVVALFCLLPLVTHAETSLNAYRTGTDWFFSATSCDLINTAGQPTNPTYSFQKFVNSVSLGSAFYDSSSCPSPLVTDATILADCAGVYPCEWKISYYNNQSIQNNTTILGTLTLNFEDSSLSGGSSLFSNNFSQSFKTKFTNATVSGTKNAVNFNITYFLELTEYNADNRPDIIGINILKDNVANDSQVAVLQNIILPLSQGTTTKTFISDYNHASGNYIAHIYFWNINKNELTFSQTAMTIKYNVNSVGVTTYTLVDISNGENLDFNESYEKCNILDVGCGIRNAGKYLFVPNQDKINEFANLYDNLWTRAPFVYLSQVPNLINSLFNQTGGSFSIGIDTGLGEVTFFNSSQVANVPNADNIKTMGSAFLWLTFAFIVYRKTLTIHNKETI